MSEKVITDFTGKPIGRLITDGNKTIVTDWCGRTLGTADANGTRDFTGKVISAQNAPELLLPR